MYVSEDNVFKHANLFYVPTDLRNHIDGSCCQAVNARRNQFLLSLLNNLMDRFSIANATNINAPLFVAKLTYI